MTVDEWYSSGALREVNSRTVFYQTSGGGRAVSLHPRVSNRVLGLC